MCLRGRVTLAYGSGGDVVDPREDLIVRDEALRLARVCQYLAGAGGEGGASLEGVDLLAFRQQGGALSDCAQELARALLDQRRRAAFGSRRARPDSQARRS